MRSIGPTFLKINGESLAYQKVDKHGLNGKSPDVTDSKLVAKQISTSNKSNKQPNKLGVKLNLTSAGKNPQIIKQIKTTFSEAARANKDGLPLIYELERIVNLINTSVENEDVKQKLTSFFQLSLSEAFAQKLKKLEYQGPDWLRKQPQFSYLSLKQQVNFSIMYNYKDLLEKVNKTAVTSATQIRS